MTERRREASSTGRALAAVEVLVAVACAGWLASHESMRALWTAGMRAIVDGARSTVALIAIDPATLWPALLVLVKVAVLLAPPARLLAWSPRRRLAWIPLGALLWPAILANVVPGVTGAAMWALFAVAGVVGWLAARRAFVRAVALLPWLVALAPLLGHGPFSDGVWTPERLAPRCAANDGTRPTDLRPELEVARYYSVTPLTPALMFVAGERYSFWARRATDGSVRLGPPMDLRANFWQGCLRDGTVWLTARGRVCEATPPATVDSPATERHTCYDVPGPPAAGVELDYVDVLCPTSRRSVYVGQLLRGGYVEYSPSTGASTWHHVIPGLNLQLVSRRDGKLVGITSSHLFVFDPETDRVVEQQAGGTVAMGVDVCNLDDSVAVADFAGRVRLYDRGSDGTYHFSAGTSVPAARRIAFSPSCEQLIVTSGDDRHAYLLRRRDLSMVRRFELGPGLRDVVFLDEHTVAVADACTVTLLDANR